MSSRVNPSQSTKRDEVQVTFTIKDKINAVPYLGFCTCTIGFSKTCAHVGATLLRAADLVASGAKEDPEDEALCTSMLCERTDPKCAKSAPSVTEELHISGKPKTMSRTVTDFRKTPPSYDAILELKYSLSMATQHLGQYCPAVHVLDVNRFQSDSTPEVVRYTSVSDSVSKEPEIAFKIKGTVELTFSTKFVLTRTLLVRRQEHC